jgi:hypothetical protein
MATRSFLLVVALAVTACGTRAADREPDAAAEPDGSDDCPLPEDVDPLGWNEEGLDFSACPDADDYFPTCEGDACASDEPTRRLLEAFRSAVADRGIEDRLLVVRTVPADVGGWSDSVGLDYVLVLDWWRHPYGILADDADDPDTMRANVDRVLPEVVPTTVPSFDEAVALFRQCDPTARISPCRARDVEEVTARAGDCGQAALSWVAEAPGYFLQCLPRNGPDCCVPDDE